MPDLFEDKEIDIMREALELARNGEGRVSPNPPVGCVLVRDGEVVGRGWHNRLGDLHAEAMALKEAGDRAWGATAYVTLSPCSSHGRQPPCADALIRARVAGVVAAAEDPNPRNTSGLDVLRRSGVPVRVGLLRSEAEYLARGFFKLMRRGRPFVTLKYAMTLDGKTATATGDSRWVSGPESLELVHDMRSRHDAVMVGSGTALADDPLLNVREPVLGDREAFGPHPQPLRVILDSNCRLSPDAAMLRPENGQGGRVLVAAVESAPPERADALLLAGAEVLLLPPVDGHAPIDNLLDDLARRGVAMILCESGGRLSAALLRAGAVDEIVAFVAPKLAGGQTAPGPVADLGIGKMAEALRLDVRESRRVGSDTMIRAAVL